MIWPGETEAGSAGHNHAETRHWLRNPVNCGKTTYKFAE
jgi:hypothetical protein